MFLYKFVLIAFVVFEVVTCHSGQVKATFDPGSKNETLQENSQAQDKKEVEKIRDELHKALEHDKESESDDSIVQPEWTKNSTTQDGPAKVVLNEKNLAETADIRSILSDAISKGKYEKGSMNEEDIVNRTDHILGMEFRKKKFKNAGEGDEDNSEDMAGDMISAVGDEAPNVVESHALETDDKDRYNIFKSKFQRRDRDTLMVKAVVEDHSFDLGYDVREWHTVLTYLVGLRETDLILVPHENFSGVTGMDIHEEISCVETFSTWNTETRMQEGIVVVGIENRLLWFRLGQLEHFWAWTIDSAVTKVVFFQVEDWNYLAVCTATSGLNLYGFDLIKHEFWLEQRISLKSICSEVGFVTTGRDSILAVAQNGSVLVYTFNPKIESHPQHLHFNLSTTFESEGNPTVATFQMGGHSYIVIGGYEPKIFRYNRGEFELETIFEQSFGFVDSFYPISARTYRDDLILLVQHVIEFDSHNLTTVEALIWNGEGFETSMQPPCISGDLTFPIGFGCLLDLERERGMQGAAVFGTGPNISLVVPRHNASSGLFHLHTEMLQKNSETSDLQEIFDFLQDWVKQQDVLIKSSEGTLQETSVANVSSPELFFDGEVDRIFVNDVQWTTNDSQIRLEELLTQLEKLSEQINSLEKEFPSPRFLREKIEFDEVFVEDLYVENWNGRPVLIREDKLIFHGRVEFEAGLNIRDTFFRSMDDHEENSFEAHSLEIDGNIRVDEINGIQWDEFLSSILIRNSTIAIDELEVDGEVHFTESFSVDKLNDLNFPDEFLWSSGPSSSVVRAEKTFLQTLVANAIDTGGLINGVNPFDVISLSDDQIIPGSTTFKQLEVSELLQVNGTINGRNLDSFLSNPDLMESTLIQSECHFNELEVLGPIFVLDKLNNNKFEEMLADVVYKTDKEAIITSKKTFGNVTILSDLKIDRNAISGIPLNYFVTKNTPQNLEIATLNGNFYVNYAQVDGLVDFVNIAELVENCIRIDQDQDVETELIFKELHAESFHVTQFLNGNPISALIRTDEDMVFDEIRSDHLEANHLISECDIDGPAALNGKNIQEYLSEWKDNDKYLNGNIYVNELILNEGFRADFLNSIETDFLISFLEKIDEIPAMIAAGKLLIDRLVVYGDVKVRKLNNEHFDEDVQSKVIWLNRPNIIRGGLKFLDDVEVGGYLTVEKYLNGANISKSFEDLILKDNTDDFITISGTKTFAKPIQVQKDIQVESINEVPFHRLATTRSSIELPTDIEIEGDLVVRKIDVGGELNGYDIGHLRDSFWFDENTQSYVLNDTVVFKNSTTIAQLTVLKSLNEIEDLTEFFENLAYKHQLMVLKGRTIFENTVIFDKGVYIKKLNGFDLMEFLDNIVFIEGPKEIEISGPVIFKDEVTAKYVSIKDHLRTSNLADCSLQDWIENGLRIDEPVEISGTMNFGQGTLDGNAFNSTYLNNCDLRTLITLHTPQNLIGHVNFTDVYLEDTIVSGTVNDGVDLKEENKNTLLIHGNQHVTAPTTLQSFRVLKTLRINNPVRGKNLSDLAVLDEDLEFHSPITFEDISVGNIMSNDLISGLNVTRWYETSLRRRGKDEQVISGNWSLGELVVKSAGFDGDRTINGRRVEEVSSELASARIDFEEFFNAEKDKYLHVCSLVKELAKKSRNRGYTLKHFETAFQLVEPHAIHRHAIFPYKDTAYLLTNVGCVSNVYEWRIDGQRFEKIATFETGEVDQVFPLTARSDECFVRLTTNSKNANRNCSVEGVSTWMIHENQVEHLKYFADHNEQFSQLHYIPNRSGKFFGINSKNNLIFEFNINPNTSAKLQSWDLPPPEKGSYRFLPPDADLGLALSDGRQLLILDQASRRRFRQKRQLKSKKRRRRKLKKRTNRESIAVDSHDSELHDYVKDACSALIHDLNTVDLSEEHFNEHILDDFMAILTELNRQNITQVDLAIFEKREELRENAALDLIARAVHVLWPEFKEVEVVYEKHIGKVGNERLKTILDVLTVGIQQILAVADSELAASDSCQKVEMAFAAIKDQLQAECDTKRLLTSTTPAPQPTGLEPFQVQLLPSDYSDVAFEGDEPIIGDPIDQNNFVMMKTDISRLPTGHNGEMITLKIGSPESRTTLMAVAEIKKHKVPGQLDTIKIYSDILTGELYQEIFANRPHLLTVLHISHDMSFLVFAENRNWIRVFQYKGIEGFVEVSKFKVQTNMTGMSSISLPLPNKFGELEKHCLRHFVVVSAGNELQFIEAVVDGTCGVQEDVDCEIWK